MIDMISEFEATLMEFGGCMVSMSYRISPADVPMNWKIEREEGENGEVNNTYRHEHLAVNLHLTGVATDDPNGPSVVYDVAIHSGGGVMGVDYWFETEDPLTEFEDGRNYAIALMIWMELLAQEGTDEYVSGALHLVSPEYHDRPESGSSAEDAWVCPVCGMDTGEYRGMSNEETMDRHFEHMVDDDHVADVEFLGGGRGR